MTSVATVQDPQAVLLWSMDWSPILSANGSPTIVTATASSTTTGATVDQVTHDATTVSYRLSCSTVPEGTLVPVTVHVVLSNGESDDRTKTIRIRQR